MSQVISFEAFRPSPRYDEIVWTEARIEEGTTVSGPWTLLETIPLDPLDADPANPATRDFTTELASEDLDLWYRIIFVDATGDVAQPTIPIQNSSLQSIYASVDELARILKIRAPTTAQRAAMNRVLVAAAAEINDEIDLPAESELSGFHLRIAETVNLERAVEHWRQQEAPFGLLGLGTEFGGGVERTARDSWERHAHKLAPLKQQWGLA